MNYKDQHHSNTSSANPPYSEETDTEEKIIPLLEERLFVENNREKIGEVIIRKEIETEIIKVPVKREKLIVEQVSPEKQQLAEIHLSNENKQQIAEIHLNNENISGVELITDTIPEFINSSDRTLTVSGEFTSPKIASLLLNAIAQEKNNGCQKIKVTIFVENESQQQKYQAWFNRCSHTSHT